MEMECKHKVKPFPYGFCEKCMLNGCYPWNRNPLLLCTYLGGLHLAILVVDDNDVARECSSYKLVTEETWKAHLEDLKKQAELNETCRRKAIDGEVLTSEPLPAESLAVNGS